MGMQKVVTFGEIMLRLKPRENERIIQTDSFSGLYGGAEANVAVSLALLGDNAQFVSKVPAHAIGQAALGALSCYGVDTSEIHRGGPRLGIYFFEKGASIRNTSVVYDRAGSSFAVAPAEEYDWDQILQDAGYFTFQELRPRFLLHCKKHFWRLVNIAQSMILRLSVTLIIGEKCGHLRMLR